MGSSIGKLNLEVDVYTTDHLDHCPIRIIQFYLSKLPCDRKCHSLYLQPRKKFEGKSWYLDKPCGENKLRNIIKEMCKDAGLPGFYSNHSLRSTSATKLYRNDFDEQLIQEIMGHRSLAVWSYKRTCNSQRKEASNCLFSA